MREGYIGDGEREHIIQSVGGRWWRVIYYSVSPASPLHPALPSGRVTGGLRRSWRDMGHRQSRTVLPLCTACPRTRYPETRDRDKTPVQPISSVLSAQPGAMAIGPVGVIGCRRPLTGRAKGDFRQVERSPAPGRGTHFSPPSALSLSLSLSCSSASAPRPLLAPRPLASSGHLPLCQSILALPSLPSLTALFLHALTLLSTVSRHHPPFRRILLVAPGPESSCRVEA
jgi:hypothetical protein